MTLPASDPPLQRLTRFAPSPTGRLHLGHVLAAEQVWSMAERLGAPVLLRVATDDVTIARGTRRATRIPKGSTVIVGFASAMMDKRHVPEPHIFDAGRQDSDYVHFGHGLHECFGRFMNEATLHRILKPLLERKNLQRASGSEGHLQKNGIFSERLVVTFE